MLDVSETGGWFRNEFVVLGCSSISLPSIVVDLHAGGDLVKGTARDVAVETHTAFRGAGRDRGRCPAEGESRVADSAGVEVSQVGSTRAQENRSEGAFGSNDDGFWAGWFDDGIIVNGEEAELKSTRKLLFAGLLVRRLLSSRLDLDVVAFLAGNGLNGWLEGFLFPRMIESLSQTGTASNDTLFAEFAILFIVCELFSFIGSVWSGRKAGDWEKPFENVEVPLCRDVQVAGDEGRRLNQ